MIDQDGMGPGADLWPDEDEAGYDEDDVWYADDEARSAELGEPRRERRSVADRFRRVRERWREPRPEGRSRRPVVLTVVVALVLVNAVVLLLLLHHRAGEATGRVRAAAAPSAAPPAASPSAPPASPSTPPAMLGDVPGAEPVLDMANGAIVRGVTLGCGRAAPLYRSDDSGHTWYRLPAPPVDVLRIRVLDPRIIWFVGADASCRTHLYRTGDGGKTWRTLPSAIGAWYRPPGADPGRLHVPGALVDGPCPDGAAMRTVVGLSRAAGTVLCHDGSVFQSGNDGRSWQPLLVPTGVRAIAFADPRTGFVAAPAAGCTGVGIYGSTDGGTDWRQLGCVPASADQPLALGFADARQGVLTASDAVYHTADGGQSWERVR